MSQKPSHGLGEFLLGLGKIRLWKVCMVNDLGGIDPRGMSLVPLDSSQKALSDGV